MVARMSDIVGDMPFAIRRRRIDRSERGPRLVSLLCTLAAMACTRALSPASGGSSPSSPAEVVAPRAAVPGQETAAPAAAARPTEAALRRHFASLERGEPNYDDMVPALADRIRAHPEARKAATELMPVRSMDFKGTGPRGADIYEVTSDGGLSDWRIMLAPDGKIMVLFFHAHGKPPDVPPSDEQFAADLAAHVRAAAVEEEFSGALLVARGTEPIVQLATGLADRERELPNTLQTKFRIGSMNKMFTAVAILQLVQRGKLSLDDPLGKFVKDYPNPDVARQVTIERLLTHTAGTGDIFGPEFSKHRRELRKLDDYVALFGKRDLAFAPGDRFEYSNFGFLLLGVVIERVTGQSYYDYVAQHVYAPAGMRDTGSSSLEQAVAHRSIGYTRFRPEGSAKPKPSQVWFPNTSALPYRGNSAGGGYSTLADLLAFANALEQHRLLDAEHTALLTTAKRELTGGADYAFGFVDNTVGGVRCMGHAGGAPGMSGLLHICRRAGEATSFVIAVLSNQDPPAAPAIGEYVRLRLPAGSAPANSAPTAAARACAELRVDDLEDGDVRAAASAELAGTWQTYHDRLGTTLSPDGPFTPSPGGLRGSKHALHIAGTLGATRDTWAGIELRASTPVDLTPWAAVCFQAKGMGFARFTVADRNTDPAGGVCRSCYNHFGATIELGADWKEHCVAFDDMTQQYGWGEPHPAVTATRIFGMNWAVHGRMTGSSYDLWVDDVRLVCR
jgi:D-alanyl-D-alanine carboxypeptidase